MILIEDFWRIDDDIQSKWGKKLYQYINYCGLEPVRPLENFDYFCTPINSLTFAATGGDGVHFGIINGKNDKGEIGPIVMTVPMADRSNIIVAENLVEFFSIGYYVGWFPLEQLAYDEDATISSYSESDVEISEKERRFLEIVRTNFSIIHKPLTKERLSELQKQYYSRLDIGNIEDWNKKHSI